MERPHPVAAAAEGQPSLDDVEETVRSLIAMMSAGSISELDLAYGDLSVRLRSQQQAVAGPALTPVVAESESSGEPESADEVAVLTAPMIGTYYAAPTPGDPPFVVVGDIVEAGQTIGIIEAMKIMNEITAERSGRITEILVANAQAVEYGSPLMRIVEEKDSA